MSFGECCIQAQVSLAARLASQVPKYRSPKSPMPGTMYLSSFRCGSIVPDTTATSGNALNRAARPMPTQETSISQSNGDRGARQTFWAGHQVHKCDIAGADAMLGQYVYRCND